MPELEKKRVPPARLTKAVVEYVLLHAPETVEIWFHGSRATGTHRRSSDWDFLFVVPEDIGHARYAGLGNLSGPFGRHVRLEGKQCDIQAAKLSNADRWNASVMAWAMREGRVIWRRVPEKTK